MNKPSESGPEKIDSYIRNAPETVREKLEQVRAAIREAAAYREAMGKALNSCESGEFYQRPASLREIIREIKALLTAALSAPAISEGREGPDLGKVREELKAVKDWASRRCPCENEEPNPCPLCGASVENLEACKAVESIIPRRIISNIDAALLTLTEEPHART